MRWKVYVAGDAIDLGILRAEFPSTTETNGGVKFGQNDQGTYFETPRLDDYNDASELHRAAEKVVREINGLARVLDSTFRPVTLEGRYEDEAGKNSLVVAVDTVEVRSHVAAGLVVIGGEPRPQPPPPPGPKLFELADVNPDVAEALLLMGSPSPLGWYELYKLYEVITHNLGGEAALVGHRWTTRAELSAFRVSANRHDVSGSEARHARSKERDLPRRTMALPEARDYMRTLTLRWLNSLR